VLICRSLGLLQHHLQLTLLVGQQVLQAGVMKSKFGVRLATVAVGVQFCCWGAVVKLDSKSCKQVHGGIRYTRLGQ
jgi:hypothetical protein